MTRGPRRNHTPAFKAKVALAALKGESLLTNAIRRFGTRSSPSFQSRGRPVTQSELSVGERNLSINIEHEPNDPIVGCTSTHCVDEHVSAPPATISRKALTNKRPTLTGISSKRS
jgi:hypothetical protein